MRLRAIGELFADAVPAASLLGLQHPAQQRRVPTQLVPELSLPQPVSLC